MFYVNWNCWGNTCHGVVQTHLEAISSVENNRRISPVEECFLSIISSFRAGNYTQKHSSTGDVRRLFQRFADIVIYLSKQLTYIAKVIVIITYDMLSYLNKQALCCYGDSVQSLKKSTVYSVTLRASGVKYWLALCVLIQIFLNPLTHGVTKWTHVQ